MAKRKAWYALFTRFGISEYPRNAKCFSCWDYIFGLI
jgi:hypothetical protein